MTSWKKGSEFPLILAYLVQHAQDPIPPIFQTRKTDYYSVVQECASCPLCHLVH